MLSVDVEKTLHSRSGVFHLRLQRQATHARVVLLGPSGSGKTLSLQMIAGLVQPDRGQIRLGEAMWYDHQHALNWPVQTRRLGYLPQDYALFPHLTVRQNIAFALSPGWRNPAAAARHPQVEDWLERMQLAAQADQYPAQLSGGQKQRTALARTLITQPRLLLLDEPFAALDAPLRQQMRREVLALQQQLQIPLLLISHDPADADLLAEEVWTLPPPAP